MSRLTDIAHIILVIVFAVWLILKIMKKQAEGEDGKKTNGSN